MLATTASGSALPAWLSFKPSTRTFSGTPTSADVGTIAVRGTASDLGSLAASETFNITVSTTPNGAASTREGYEDGAPKQSDSVRTFDLRDPRGDSKISRSPSMGRRWNHIGICDDDLGVCGTGAELAWSPGD
ncbi:hypothetical protein CN163_24835 [Sinorhizobium meliloti]|nr:putative Ig domain-containing protein [Sinorhizobium meliloti]RVK32566.1 hypothetical protein CN163_24835 [Sinorhizobium meliloti]